MSKKIVIDPITRIEGHLKVEVEIENNKIVDARCSGMLYRGLEKILIGRDPRDANQITQRICGVCPMAHAIASAICLDDAFGISDKITKNGWLLRNLIHVSNHIHNSILHFYHLSALDYVDVSKVSKGVSSELDLVCKFLERDKYYPFVPREEDFRLPQKINERMVYSYLKALEIRRTTHEMLAVFGGKMPHQCGIVPGGVSQNIDAGKIESFLGKLKDVKEFIEFYYIRDLIDVATYYPEYFEIGKGCRNYLAYGVFPVRKNGKFEKFQPSGIVIEGEKFEELNPSEIRECVSHSWYEGDVKNPVCDFPEVEIEKENAYSWIKSPRYRGEVFEVGPLARLIVAYRKGQQPWKEVIESFLSELKIDIEKLSSVLGRHIARAIEAKVLTEEAMKWLLQINPEEPFYINYEIPEEAEGMGLSEAARGAVGHWIKIENKKIAHYQVISPTTWNASPKDDKGKPGPIEQALLGTKIKDENNPVEVLRIVRSFDPCLACAVQIMNRKKMKSKKVMLWV